ncbi:hypothetical protein [Streptomyces sp. NBC_00076]|uniref:hypothetical protein n=1 Tax=Streptomyces sp. NBC_00076 TaxID=2975642 RepID=UPI003251B559
MSAAVATLVAIAALYLSWPDDETLPECGEQSGYDVTLRPSTQTVQDVGTVTGEMECRRQESQHLMWIGRTSIKDANGSHPNFYTKGPLDEPGQYSETVELARWPKGTKMEVAVYVMDDAAYKELLDRKGSDGAVPNYLPPGVRPISNKAYVIKAS